MSDFNPGPGWREVDYAPMDGEEEYLVHTPVDDTKVTYWARVPPVPPLVGRPVEGIVLTPEEAALAADALRAAFAGTSPQFHEADVLASRLEAGE